ncbi:hypothetical protein XI03_20265 [Bradyrhizobium sp. CCBAU 65884]|nr:hypothetical protein [Bradyrhizobium sp. CCBAU 65884]
MVDSFKRRKRIRWMNYAGPLTFGRARQSSTNGLPLTPKSWSEGLKAYSQPKYKIQFDVLSDCVDSHQEIRSTWSCDRHGQIASSFELVIDRSSEMTRDIFAF